MNKCSDHTPQPGRARLAELEAENKRLARSLAASRALVAEKDVALEDAMEELCDGCQQRRIHLRCRARKQVPARALTEEEMLKRLDRKEA